jgi:RNA polymerase sigma-70 factor (ECF subfamily)
MEGQLAVAIANGSPAIVADEYVAAARANVHAAYLLAGYILGDGMEAQDAVQDALVKAWRNWSSLRQVDSFEPWFRRIVVNVCRDRLRRHRTLQMVDLTAAAEVASDDAFASMLEGDSVVRAVTRLSPDQRIVIALRYWHDLPLEQVAETLGVPLGTAKSRLHYALAALRSEMKETER